MLRQPAVELGCLLVGRLGGDGFQNRLHRRVPPLDVRFDHVLAGVPVVPDRKAVLVRQDEENVGLLILPAALLHGYRQDAQLAFPAEPEHLRVVPVKRLESAVGVGAVPLQILVVIVVAVLGQLGDEDAVEAGGTHQVALLEAGVVDGAVPGGGVKGVEPAGELVLAENAVSGGEGSVQPAHQLQDGLHVHRLAGSAASADDAEVFVVDEQVIEGVAVPADAEDLIEVQRALGQVQPVNPIRVLAGFDHVLIGGLARPGDSDRRRRLGFQGILHVHRLGRVRFGVLVRLRRGRGLGRRSGEHRPGGRARTRLGGGFHRRLGGGVYRGGGLGVYRRRSYGNGGHCGIYTARRFRRCHGNAERRGKDRDVQVARLDRAGKLQGQCLVVPGPGGLVQGYGGQGQADGIGGQLNVRRRNVRLERSVGGDGHRGVRRTVFDGGVVAGKGGEKTTIIFCHKR